MASRIDSDSPSKALRRQAEDKTSPASSKPTASGSTPKPIPKRRAPQAAAEQPETGRSEDQNATVAGRGLFGKIPAWGVSMLVHVIAILVLALIASDPVRIDKPTVITSSVAEDEQEITDLELEQPVPDEAPEVAGASESVDVTTPEMAVTPEVTVDAVLPSDVVAPATGVDAAALVAIDAADFSSDLLAKSGAAGGGGVVGLAGGFGGRGNPGAGAMAGGGGPDTEMAVDRALRWFAEHQMPDGGWDFDLTKCPSCSGKCSKPGNNKNRSGATALALLPFLGRGYTHREGPFQKQVGAGIDFLVQGLDEKGKAYDDATAGSGALYTQGLVGIVLAECYGMSQDTELAAPAQSVLNFIMEAQGPAGGWRYIPRELGADTSVVGWQIMALKSGHMAYLDINPVTIQNASKFLDGVEGDGELYGMYGYSRKPGDPKKPDDFATTAIGHLCRMYMGMSRDHPDLSKGIVILAERGPTTDLYYDYYATQVMHHFGGDMWTAWNTRMKKLLLETQSANGHEAGSWFQGVNSGHMVGSVGRLYCTSLATLILEVYYRHLPLYGNQSVQGKFGD